MSDRHDEAATSRHTAITMHWTIGALIARTGHQKSKVNEHDFGCEQKSNFECRSDIILILILARCIVTSEITYSAQWACFALWWVSSMPNFRQCICTQHRCRWDQRGTLELEARRSINTNSLSDDWADGWSYQVRWSLCCHLLRFACPRSPPCQSWTIWVSKVDCRLCIHKSAFEWSRGARPCSRRNQKYG